VQNVGRGQTLVTGIVQPYLIWCGKKLERREYKVQFEGLVTGWQVQILGIGLKMYWNSRKNKTWG